MTTETQPASEKTKRPRRPAQAKAKANGAAVVTPREVRERTETKRARASREKAEREATQLAEAKRTAFVEARDRLFLAVEGLAKADAAQATAEDRELIRGALEQLRPLTRRAGSTGAGGVAGSGLSAACRDGVRAGVPLAELVERVKAVCPTSRAVLAGDAQVKAAIRWYAADLRKRGEELPGEYGRKA